MTAMSRGERDNRAEADRLPRAGRLGGRRPRRRAGGVPARRRGSRRTSDQAARLGIEARRSTAALRKAAGLPGEPLARRGARLLRARIRPLRGRACRRRRLLHRLLRADRSRARACRRHIFACRSMPFPTISSQSIRTVPIRRSTRPIVSPGARQPGLRPTPTGPRSMRGHLQGRGLELVYLADPVDAFFIHVQGAARIELADGRTMRVTYAAKTGHPYTSIGAVLVKTGALSLAEATMQGIRPGSSSTPTRRPAVMAAEPVVHLLPRGAGRRPGARTDRRGQGPADARPQPRGRPAAAQLSRTGLGRDDAPRRGARFSRLLVAQDTGSAIVGPARGDIFFGSGDAAGDSRRRHARRRALHRARAADGTP